MAFHLRQRNARDGGGRGHRGAADGAKGCTGQNGGHGQTPFKSPHDAGRKLKQGLANAALGCKVAHQNKQGNDRQVITCKSREGQVVEKARIRAPTRLNQITQGSC